MEKRTAVEERAIPLTHLSYQILLALSGQNLHGYAIIKTVRENPTYPVNPGTGTFYSALGRMLDEGLIAEIDAPDDAVGDSRRRFYSMTDLGHETVVAETKRLEQLVGIAKAAIASATGRGR